MDSQDVAKSIAAPLGCLQCIGYSPPQPQSRLLEAGMPDGIAGYAVGRLGGFGRLPCRQRCRSGILLGPRLSCKANREGTHSLIRKKVHRFTQRSARSGAKTTKGFDGIERLGELAERVVNNASPLGAPLFVGWRDQTLPEPGAGRTMQLCQTLRELGFLGSAQQCSAQACHHSRDYEWANGSVERRDVRLEGNHFQMANPIRVGAKR